MKAPLPKNEVGRLAALHKLKILDTPEDRSFNDLASLASIICETPTSLVSLVDTHRQWFKAKVGMNECQTHRDFAFCAHAILHNEILIIEDATRDVRFKDNPLVTNAPYIRFYAGAPIFSGDGHALGTLCVIDFKPRKLDASQTEALKKLSQQVGDQFETHRMNLELRQAIKSIKKSEAKSRLVSARLISLLEHFDAGIVATNEKSLVIYMNQIFCKDFKINDQGNLFINSPIEKLKAILTVDIKTNSDNANIEIFSSRTDTDKTTTIQRFEIARHSQDYQFSSIPVWVQDDYYGHLYMFRNMTDYNVAQRTIERQKATLIESSRLAAMGDMASGIAHEINNPLAIIQGRIDNLLLRVKQNSFSHEYLEETVLNINKIIARISKITKGLQYFARDATEDPSEVVSLNSILLDSLSFCESRIRNQGIKIDVLPISEDLKVLVRPVQISQVILNLLNNAFDSIELLPKKWIRVEAIAKDSSIVLMITDSGPGIPKQTADKMFSPFFTTKKVGKGTGLGLSISKGIIEAHGGKLWYRTESKNTCFCLQLPRNK